MVLAFARVAPIALLNSAVETIQSAPLLPIFHRPVSPRPFVSSFFLYDMPPI